MSDRTCGTCAIGQQPSVWCSCSDEVKPADLPACGDYFERADSVEQVARDMLVELACISAFTPDSAKEGVAAMHCRAFLDRLRALGVVE